MTYVLPERLAHVVPEGKPDQLTVFLMKLPDGPPLVLEGSAALIWMAAAAGEPDVPSAVAREVHEPIEEIAPSVDDYLGVLVSRDLLRVSSRDDLAW